MCERWSSPCASSPPGRWGAGGPGRRAQPSGLFRTGKPYLLNQLAGRRTAWVTINAVTAMGTIENEAAVREALAHYVAGMRGLRVPAELGELLAMHGTCEEDALRLFVQRSFKDEGYTYQKRLMAIAQFVLRAGGLAGGGCYFPSRARRSQTQQEQPGTRAPRSWGEWCFQSWELSPEAIKESYRRSLGQNEAASKDSCRALLETLSAAMQRSQGSEGLEQFLASKRIEAETVLNVDKNLTEAEKDLASLDTLAALEDRCVQESGHREWPTPCFLATDGLGLSPLQGES
ncbi:unnamed protein product [Caretta caretta]